MPITPEARQRLADLMDVRRQELDKLWQDVARDGGISLKALHTARTGGSGIRPSTRRSIEKGLHWERMSVDRILDGGEPANQPDPATLSRPAPEADPDEIGAYERQVWAEVADALGRHGRDAAGARVFPGSAVEQDIWDTRRLRDDKAKVCLIAKLRSIADESAGESRTG